MARVPWFQFAPQENRLSATEATGLLTTGAAAGCSATPSYGSAMNLLALAPVVAVGLAFFLPESAGVELEALNPDDPEPDDRPYTSTT